MDCYELLKKHRERWVREQMALMECRDVAEAADDETLLQAVHRIKSELDVGNIHHEMAKREGDRLRDEITRWSNRCFLAENRSVPDDDFNAYKIPIGTEFVLGKRRWCLVERMEFHPDFLTFREVSQSPHTPDRVYNPSEVEAMYKLGVAFQPPAPLCDDCGRPRPLGVCDTCHPVVKS